jgi:ABC-2 type transport system ATP-binding protein
MALLKVENVGKHYSGFALEDISFELPKGYIMGYVGQNGAGKTTTLNVITHLCKCDFGTISIDGISYEDDPIRYKKSIGYVGDESYFPEQIRIKEVKAILKEFYPDFKMEEFDRRAEEWKLPPNKKIGEFSRGMKVKLMFAAVLSRNTKLLILDEATNGLDPVMRADVLKLLQEYIADGEKSVLFSTHILSDLEQIADYIFFIHDGKKIFFDAKDEILEKYLVVKGDIHDIDDTLQKELIGIEQNEFGFEAVLEADKAGLLSQKFIFEKPDIDRIVIHFIRERQKIM